MKASLKKRSMAYSIDILIVAFLASIISLFLPISSNQIELGHRMSTLGETYLSNNISLFTYLQSYSFLSHHFDKGNILLYVLEAILLFLYYQILPYIWDGKTIGCKLMHIKIKNQRSKKVGFSTLLIRNLWMNGFGYFILYIIVLYLFSDLLYLFGITILAILQFLVVIASIFMIKYRSDKRSFADIMSQSNIVIES